MESPHKPSTAWHEAGHAVIALALDRPVKLVSVLPSREFAGICEFGKGVHRPSVDSLEREMLIALAGLAAEAKYSGRYSWAGAGRDLEYAHGLAVQRGGEKQAERLIKRMLARCENLLEQPGHWAAVALIVEELLAHGEISGRTAKYLFERGMASCE